MVLVDTVEVAIEVRSATGGGAGTRLKVTFHRDGDANAAEGCAFGDMRRRMLLPANVRSAILLEIGVMAGSRLLLLCDYAYSVVVCTPGCRLGCCWRKLLNCRDNSGSASG